VAQSLLIFDFPEDASYQRLRFEDPAEVLVARSVGEVRPALRAVQDAVARGFYAAGYLAYEAAPAFDHAFVVRQGSDLPLLWFAIYDKPGDAHVETEPGGYMLSEWRPATTRSEYDRSIGAVRTAIASGDTYQVNYTIRLRAGFDGDALALYERLRAAQGARYCAFLDLGDRQILSLSPELFFHWRGDTLVTRPMKGTAARGRWPAEDRQLAAWLAASDKNRAENLMIVDLLRNDVGRVARIGSVRVPELFAVERYRTVHQMTSTVTASVRAGIRLEDVFAALFPCGSITGAPKVRTMELIAGLEDTPRGVYCGAIGLVRPGGEALFNVAIRTLTVDRQLGMAEYGVGGGITWDSNAADEYGEALLKAALLTESWPDFELLETLRLEQGVYILLDRHLGRLAVSAEYFGIPLAVEEARAALPAHARAFPAGTRRVRLLVGQNGVPRVESQPLDTTLPFWQRGEGLARNVAFARAPVSRRDRFLYHKTTNRALYDARRAERPDVFDVLLFNEEGEATEFTIGNLVIQCDGGLWTPPIDCGVLEGTLRAELLERRDIGERLLTRAQVEGAERCWLINSVRGWVPVKVVA
jgi:para-aminobenzoate synthetase / 4-amino-4-deoxychorismate lyase